MEDPVSNDSCILEMTDRSQHVNKIHEINVIHEHNISSAYELVTNTSDDIVRNRSPTYTPKFPENAPSILTFENIVVKTKDGNSTELLKGVSGSITGGLWAIMGASGGGKTTLLSTLSLRLDSKHMDISGSIRLNGREYDKSVLKSMSAYVMQDDVLHAELTVMETLKYAAELRLPPQLTNVERLERIEEVIELMGISHRKDVIVGDSRIKGISGGERKRLCIAVELLAKPKLLFLDEPTSGLDSSTALTVIDSLHELSNQGYCTVICTIHQPQQKIFNLFDNLMLMKRGMIVYQGSCQKSLIFLESIGLPCPPGVNPADHLLEAISPTRKESVADRVDKHGERTVPIDLSLGFGRGEFSMKNSRSWLSQFVILSRRNVQQYIRRKDIIVTNIVATVVLALFIGLGIWHNIGTSQASIATRVPSLFFAAVSQGVLSSLQTVNSFPKERVVMIRERAAGTYYVSSYFMAKTAVDMAFQLMGPVLFAILIYPLIGYQPRADKFFVYLGFMILDTYAATALATAVSCLCVSIDLSTVILSVLFEICRLYGGFFTSPKQLDSYPGWKFADVLSYIKYTFVGIALNELTDLELSCTSQEISSGTCTSTGEAISASKGYNEYSMELCAGLLILYIFIFRFIGYLGLRFIKN